MQQDYPGRPGPGESSPYFVQYTSLVPTGDIVVILAALIEEQHG